MTDWVHALAIDWGHHLRRLEAQSSLVQGTLGRIVEQGPDGAAIRVTFSAKVPVIDWPRHVAEFHRAWLELEELHQAIIFIDYKLRLPVKRKFRLAGKKKDAYYRARANAKLALAGKLDSRIPSKTRNI